MASESSEQLTVSVELPAELVDWLDEEASGAEVDRETMVTQLLASYRTMTKLDEGLEDDETLLDTGDLIEAVEGNLSEEIEQQVEATLASEIDQQVEATVAEAVEDQVETLLTDRLTEATNGVRRQLGTRIDSVEEEFQGKLKDVRQRVIQVKKEADKKAPADHTHPEFERLSVLQEEVDTIESEFDELHADYQEAMPELQGRTEDHADRLEEIHERLQTVAWVVSDLREAQQTSSGLEAVERIKRAAARADIERAKCENCGEGVNISLMTDPHCPHCDATLTNVESSSGWFGNPTLTVASQLESGESE
jgi:predicted Zn-ribbon and HTH transcriptional regulator